MSGFLNNSNNPRIQRLTIIGGLLSATTLYLANKYAKRSNVSDMNSIEPTPSTNTQSFQASLSNLPNKITAPYYASKQKTADLYKKADELKTSIGEFNTKVAELKGTIGDSSAKLKETIHKTKGAGIKLIKAYAKIRNGMFKLYNELPSFKQIIDRVTIALFLRMYFTRVNTKISAAMAILKSLYAFTFATGLTDGLLIPVVFDYYTYFLPYPNTVTLLACAVYLVADAYYTQKNDASFFSALRDSIITQIMHPFDTIALLQKKYNIVVENAKELSESIDNFFKAESKFSETLENSLIEADQLAEGLDDAIQPTVNAFAKSQKLANEIYAERPTIQETAIASGVMSVDAVTNTTLNLASYGKAAVTTAIATPAAITSSVARTAGAAMTSMFNALPRANPAILEQAQQQIGSAVQNSLVPNLT